MGLCVSVQKSSEPMKVGLSFGSKTEKHTIPPSPVKEKQANGNRPVKSQSPSTVKDFGSKEDTFFDSQAWLDSDCEDDFYSVNGDFTPSRGSTPVHHSFSGGTTPVHKALVSRTPSPIPEPSPTGEKKKLLELFKESIGEDPDFDEHTSGNQSVASGKPGVKSTILDLPPKSANGTPLVSGSNSVSSSGSTAKGGDDTKGMEKPIRASLCCLPSLVSHRGRRR
ncbi:hypothetical protein SLE2022_281980 [Rubroshorea leprosula]